MLSVGNLELKSQVNEFFLRGIRILSDSSYTL